MYSCREAHAGPCMALLLAADSILAALWRKCMGNSVRACYLDFCPGLDTSTGSRTGRPAFALANKLKGLPRLTMLSPARARLLPLSLFPGKRFTCERAAMHFPPVVIGNRNVGRFRQPGAGANSAAGQA